jgi:8-oxo-dGTP diphosphatase
MNISIVKSNSKKPRFRATVTVSLIVIQDNQILLLRRYNTGYADGQYGLVAGCVDEAESITQAMIREAYEEAGITLLPEWLKLCCVMYCSKGERNTECVDFIFTAAHWSGAIKNNEPHKCDDLRFFPLNNLPSNIIPHVKEGIINSLKSDQFFIEYGW